MWVLWGSLFRLRTVAPMTAPFAPGLTPLMWFVVLGVPLIMVARPLANREHGIGLAARLTVTAYAVVLWLWLIVAIAPRVARWSRRSSE